MKIAPTPLLVATAVVMSFTAGAFLQQIFNVEAIALGVSAWATMGVIWMLYLVFRLGKYAARLKAKKDKSKEESE